MEVNRCGELEFASYCTQVKATYDKMNEILRWKIVADLTPFGGKGMKLKECKTPIIVNPYENMSFPLFCGTRKPGLCNVKVDNYSGEITVLPDETYKVRWVADGKIIKTHFKYTYPFVSTLCVKDMCAESLRFHLIGKAEEYISEKFTLMNA